MFDRDKPRAGPADSSRNEDRPSNQTFVRFTRQDVDDATRLLSRIAKSATPAGEGGSREPDAPAYDQERIILQATARQIFLLRRERLKKLNPAMFGEPAWDMLLALYFTAGAGPRQTISQLTKMSNAPATSALRWVQYLEKEQLVVREPHPNDRRVVFIELTEKAEDVLEDYLKSLPELGIE